MPPVRGRASAPEALRDAADTLTELRDIKHAFRAGVRAQRGVDL
jgi:cob(I)alamin adenosyltransferase